MSIIFGFAAGVVGQIVSDVYIDPYDQDILLNTGTSYPELIPELRPVKRFLGIEQDFEVSASIDRVATALVGIYQEKNSLTNILNQIYLPSDLVANGFILTADGWVVTYLNDFNVDDLVVVYNNQVFDITEQVIDDVTGISFLKISANNLPVVVLGDSEEAALGQLEVVINDINQAVVTNIKSLDYASYDSAASFVLSSEDYNEMILLADNLEDNYVGSPLINLAGEVVGVVAGDNTVIPINQFRFLIVDVLRNSLVRRSYLGVSYVDLAKTTGLKEEAIQGLTRGALIYQNPGRNTPAFIAGLKEDDVILSVDGQLINSENSLTELIQQYQPGDEVFLEISRDGQVITLSVVLAILEN